MKTLHWGKIPDAKIKGTMWDKDVKDDGVKVTASSALTPTPTPTPAPIPTLPLPSTLLKVNMSELESLFAAKRVILSTKVTLVDPETCVLVDETISRFKMT